MAYAQYYDRYDAAMEAVLRENCIVLSAGERSALSKRMIAHRISAPFEFVSALYSVSRGTQNGKSAYRIKHDAIPAFVAWLRRELASV